MDTNLQITQLLFKTFQECERKNPFPFFLLGQLHPLENDHTRILRALLSYKGEQGNFPFLESFIRHCVCTRVSDTKVPDYLCTQILPHPAIRFNDTCMDAVIAPKNFKPNQPFIIIENKVRNAADQYRQLERYIQTALSRSYDPQQIWVIYLTQDGSKKPDPTSLTPKALAYLNTSCEKRKDGVAEYFPADAIKPMRLVELNMRDHIIPWLEEKILPQIPYREQNFLLSGVLQYLYFLKSNAYLLKEQQMTAEHLMRDLVNLTLLGEENIFPQLPPITDEKLTQKINISAQKNSEKCRIFAAYGTWLMGLQKHINNTKWNIARGSLALLEKATRRYLSHLTQIPEANIATHGDNTSWMLFQLDTQNLIHFEWFFNLDRWLCGEGAFFFEFHVENAPLQAPLRAHLKTLAEKNKNLALPNYRWDKKNGRTFFSVPVALPQLLDCQTEEDVYKLLQQELTPFEADIVFLAQNTTDEVLKQLAK